MFEQTVIDDWKLQAFVAVKLRGISHPAGVAVHLTFTLEEQLFLPLIRRQFSPVDLKLIERFCVWVPGVVKIRFAVLFSPIVIAVEEGLMLIFSRIVPIILSGQKEGVGEVVVAISWLSLVGSSGLISLERMELSSRESESSKGFFFICFRRHWNPFSQGEFPLEISKRRRVSL